MSLAAPRQLVRYLALAAIVTVAVVALLPYIEQAHRFLTAAAASHHAGRELGTDHSLAGPSHGHLMRTRSRRAATASHALLNAGIAAGIVLGLLAALAWASSVSRLRARLAREYRAWPIHLTGHDQTLGEDLVAAVGSMGDTVAKWPRDRFWRGQPAFGFLIAYDPSKGGRVWLALVCETRHVAALDGALQQAYPNVRVGFELVPDHRPLEVSICPPALIRLKKAREPFHPVIGLDGRGPDVSPVSEGVADMLHALGRPAAVWFCIAPADSRSGYLRSSHRRAERLRRSRQRSLGTNNVREPEPSVDREEASQSAQIIEGATFHVDVEIVGPDYETCRALHAKLRNLPGARNELVRRPMALRRGLYRKRFETFTPPLVMRGRGKLMTAGELAGLLELPSARLKAPVGRLPVPRADAPPAVAEGSGRVPTLEPANLDRPTPDEAEVREMLAASADGMQIATQRPGNGEVAKESKGA